MGKRGPQKKPQVIKRLEGNPGQYPLNDYAPEASGNPLEPKHLCDYGLSVWHRITGSMPPALYGACDSGILTAYCAAEALHKKSIEALREDCEIAFGQNGAPYQNPWVSIQNKQAQIMATLGSRLGLDPSARSSLSIPQGAKKESRFGDLIGIKGGSKK